MLLFLVWAQANATGFELEDVLFEPQSIKITHDGQILVADAGEHAVFLFAANGDLALRIGRHGQGPGEFQNPSDADQMSDGRIFVADSRNGRVQIFDEKGTYLDAISISKHALGQIAVIDNHSFLLTESNGRSFSFRMGENDVDKSRYYRYKIDGTLEKSFGAIQGHSNPLLALLLNQGPFFLDGDDVIAASSVSNELLHFHDGQEEVIKYPLAFIPNEPQEKMKSITTASGETQVRMSVQLDRVCLGLAPHPNGDLVILRATRHSSPDENIAPSKIVVLSRNGKEKKVLRDAYDAQGIAVSKDGQWAFVLHELDSWTISRIAL